MKKLVLLAVVLMSVSYWGILNSKHHITVAFIPHHDIVADQRYDFLAQLKRNIDRDIDRIILLSPNHYGKGGADIQIFPENLSTARGIIEVDKDLSKLAIKNGARSTKAGFVNEHGIKNILPDIADIFPDAKLLPVIFDLNISKEKVDEFITSVAGDCADCLLLASADFSHYQPYLLSEYHDRQTIEALFSMDSNFIFNRAEVGPPPVVYAAIEWAKLFNTNKFVFKNHTNSTEIIDALYSEGTTHVFGWYESGGRVEASRSPSLTFVGDIMFDGDSDPRGNYLYPTSLLGNRILLGTDVLVGNLESTFTSQRSDDLLKFVAGEGSVKVLDYLKFNVLSLANNHARDFGYAGFVDTTESLASRDIQFINEDNFFLVEETDSKLLLISYQFGQKLDNVLSVIDEYRSSYKIVIYVHWGKEFEDRANSYQVELAHQLVDAGVSLVVGTGPHVIQGIEIYRNTPIIYSLGNFYYSEKFNPKKEGIILKATINDTGITLLPSLINFDGVLPILGNSDKATERIQELWPKADEYIKETKGGISYYFQSH